MKEKYSLCIIIFLLSLSFYHIFVICIKKYGWCVLIFYFKSHTSQITMPRAWRKQNQSEQEVALGQSGFAKRPKLTSARYRWTTGSREESWVVPCCLKHFLFQKPPQWNAQTTPCLSMWGGEYGASFHFRSDTWGRWRRTVFFWQVCETWMKNNGWQSTGQNGGGSKLCQAVVHFGLMDGLQCLGGTLCGVSFRWDDAQLCFSGTCAWFYLRMCRIQHPPPPPPSLSPQKTDVNLNGWCQLTLSHTFLSWLQSLFNVDIDTKTRT